MSSSSYHLIINNERENEMNVVEFNVSDIKLPNDSKKLNDFLIGHGAFADVYKVLMNDKKFQSDNESKEVAFKKFRFDRMRVNEEARNSELSKLKREANIVGRMSHPNIIHLVGICYDDNFFGLILELCEGGSLGNVCRNIRKPGIFSLSVLANWAHQITSAMRYLTDRNYLHRDLKADNVLVKEFVCYCADSEVNSLASCSHCTCCPLSKLTVKLSDFGLSKTVTSVGHSAVGTPAWLAPEVLQQQPGQSNWSESSDVWSFGVVLWEILAREVPQVYPVRKGQPLELKESWPRKWKEIMRQCWSMNPKQRPKFERLEKFFGSYKTENIEKAKKNLKNKRSNWTTKSTILIVCLPVLILMNVLIVLFFMNLHQNSVAPQPSSTPAEFADPNKQICFDDYFYLAKTGYCYKLRTDLHSDGGVRHFCRLENGNLASIHSEEEHLVMIGMFQDATQNHQTTHLKIPVNGEHGKWSWIDETPVDYVSWEGGEDVAGPQNLTYAYVLYDNYDWITSPSNAFAMFFCRKPSNPGVIWIPPPERKECPEDYTFFSQTGSCYKVHFESSTFLHAMKTCSDEGGHVTSIHSRIENNFVLALLTRSRSRLIKQVDAIDGFDEYAWIGLQFVASKRRHDVWLDGTSADSFINWDKDQPITLKLGQSIAMSRNGGRWTNEVSRATFICKHKGL